MTRAAPSKLFWAIGDGDSMEPTLADGDEMINVEAIQGMSTDEVGRCCAVKQFERRQEQVVKLFDLFEDADSNGLNTAGVEVGEGSIMVE